MKNGKERGEGRRRLVQAIHIYNLTANEVSVFDKWNTGLGKRDTAARWRATW